MNIDCVLFDPHVVTTTTKSAEGTARPPPELSPTNIHTINVSNSDRVSSPSSLSGTTGTTPTLLRTSPSPQPTEHAHSTGSRFGEIITLMFAAMGGLLGHLVRPQSPELNQVVQRYVRHRRRHPHHVRMLMWLLMEKQPLVHAHLLGGNVTK